MKIKFDASQQFQIDAVNAVVDVFDGQPLAHGDFEISLQALASLQARFKPNSARATA